MHVFVYKGHTTVEQLICLLLTEFQFVWIQKMTASIYTGIYCSKDVPPSLYMLKLAAKFGVWQVVCCYLLLQDMQIQGSFICYRKSKGQVSTATRNILGASETRTEYQSCRLLVYVCKDETCCNKRYFSRKWHLLHYRVDIRTTF